MKRWTKEEIEILKKHYSTSTPDELLKLLPGRNIKAIKTKANKLGLSKTDETRSLIRTMINKERIIWTDEEIEILKKYYPKYGPVWIQKHLLPHRGVQSIQVKANSLGLYRDEHKWIRTEEIINTKGVTQEIRVVYKKLI